MTKKNHANFDKLVDLSRKCELFNGIAMLLEWDQETYMPKSAVKNRANQIELIAALRHETMVQKEFGETLGKLIDFETGNVLDSDLDHNQKRVVEELNRDYQQQIKLPPAFVQEFAQTTTKSTHAWMESKDKNDFSLFLPHLEKVVDLCRRRADYLGFDHHPYDALIGSYEPEMDTATLTTLFEKLKIPLTNLLKKIQTKADPESAFLRAHYPVETQFAFGQKILAAMGFEEGFARLDRSFHPMCIPLGPNDTRMTTRLNPHDVMSNICSCIHEGGHGLYHHHLPHEAFGTPLGQSCSLGMDESQSRTWETIIARSMPFWEHFFPLLQETYPENLSGTDLSSFYLAINTVEPSMIRVESDEVTYNLHILIRFEIEKALIDGTLQCKDIPECWNEKMVQYLSISPKAPAEGCLQDIHWSLGGIGYFPTYTLGNLYAAQLFEKFVQDTPQWKEQLAKGELHHLANWQRDHIHIHGRKYLPEDLCKKVTGKSLEEAPFLNYLENKYTPLYGLA